MFFRLSTLLSIAAVTAVVAAAPDMRDVNGINTASAGCSTSPNNCCQSVQPATANAVISTASALGINLSGVTGDVGLTCTSLAAGQSCTQQPACCNGNNFNGAIVLGCSPINA